MKQLLDFRKNNGLIPTIIQDIQSGEIYMLGYMNEEAFQQTLKTGLVYFYSRRRQKLWLKGESSGNRLKVKELYTDCDSDSLLVKVELLGTKVCHTGNRSCFYTKLEDDL